MLRAIVTILFAVALAATSRGQAPIERLPPVTPLQSASEPLSAWPQAGVLPAHSAVQISTFGGVSHVCPLLDIEPDRIGCSATRHDAAQFFYRKDVQSIALVPKKNVAVDVIEPLALYGGLGSLSLSSMCAVDGGPVCRTPGIVGAALLATGGVMHLVKRHQRNKPLRLIYVGHLPSTASDSQATTKTVKATPTSSGASSPAAWSDFARACL